MNVMLILIAVLGSCTNFCGNAVPQEGCEGAPITCGSCNGGGCSNTIRHWFNATATELEVDANGCCYTAAVVFCKRTRTCASSCVSNCLPSGPNVYVWTSSYAQDFGSTCGTGENCPQS